MLDHDRFPVGRGNLAADLADLGRDVIRRSWAGVVHDVEDRDAAGTGAGQQAGRLGEGVLRAVQLHDTAPVGVLAVDHDQGRVRQRSRLIAQPEQPAQGYVRGHGHPLSPGVLPPQDAGTSCHVLCLSRLESQAAKGTTGMPFRQSPRRRSTFHPRPAAGRGASPCHLHVFSTPSPHPAARVAGVAALGSRLAWSIRSITLRHDCWPRPSCEIRRWPAPRLLPCHAAGCYRRLRVTWVTPLGLFTASIRNRSSSPSSPSQSRSPRPSTIGTTTMCA